jgi:hypothetical protein
MSDPLQKPLEDASKPALFGSTRELAGAVAAANAGNRRAQILHLLGSRGPMALFEVAAALGCFDHQISGRFTDLAGRPDRATGERKKSPRPAASATSGGSASSSPPDHPPELRLRADAPGRRAPTPTAASRIDPHVPGIPYARDPRRLRRGRPGPGLAGHDRMPRLRPRAAPHPRGHDQVPHLRPAPMPRRQMAGHDGQTTRHHPHPRPHPPGDMKAIDLFAGIGGWTLGAKRAGVRVVWAANHWRVAVDYHAANHPETMHACQDLHQANWLEVPRHDFLLASPCCQGHTRSRGKGSAAPRRQPRHRMGRRQLRRSPPAKRDRRRERRGVPPLASLRGLVRGAPHARLRAKRERHRRRRLRDPATPQTPVHHRGPRARPAFLEPAPPAARPRVGRH